MWVFFFFLPKVNFKGKIQREKQTFKINFNFYSCIIVILTFIFQSESDFCREINREAHKWQNLSCL